MNAQASPFSTSVKVNMMNALNLISSIPMTSGDEAGSAHPMVKMAQRYTLGSFNVFIEGMPGIHLGSLTTHNNMNCPVGAVIVPSAPNVTYSLASSGAVDPRATRAISNSEYVALGQLGSSIRELLQHEGELTLRLGVIGEAAAHEVEAALRSAGPVERLVLDLSESPGGSLEGAVTLASLFLADGLILGQLVEQDGDTRLLVSRGGACFDMPLTLLISDQTASSAELLAGALSHHGRAVLRGERSFGKGVTHELGVACDGEVALVRSGEVLLPSGASIDGVGVTP
jgi:carboxyl-terminal processing protease